MKQHKTFGLYTLTLVGLMAALVFVGSKLEFRIPSVLGVTRIHLGNSMCLLSGFLLGGVPGGLAAGLGSFLFDVFFYPATPAEWLVTFLTKFAMGFSAGALLSGGFLAGAKQTVRYIVCGAAGALVYVVLYLLKSFVTYYIILSNPLPAVLLMLVQKGTASLVNAVIAVVISVPVCMALLPRLKQAGILRK